MTDIELMPDMSLYGTQAGLLCTVTQNGGIKLVVGKDAGFLLNGNQQYYYVLEDQSELSGPWLNGAAPDISGMSDTEAVETIEQALVQNLKGWAELIYWRIVLPGITDLNYTGTCKTLACIRDPLYDFKDLNNNGDSNTDATYLNRILYPIYQVIPGFGLYISGINEKTWTQTACAYIIVRKTNGDKYDLTHVTLTANTADIVLDIVDLSNALGSKVQLEEDKAITVTGQSSGVQYTFTPSQTVSGTVLNTQPTLYLCIPFRYDGSRATMQKKCRLDILQECTYTLPQHGFRAKCTKIQQIGDVKRQASVSFSVSIADNNVRIAVTQQNDYAQLTGGMQRYIIQTDDIAPSRVFDLHQYDTPDQDIIYAIINHGIPGEAAMYAYLGQQFNTEDGNTVESSVSWYIQAVYRIDASTKTFILSGITAYINTFTGAFDDIDPDQDYINQQVTYS